MIIFLFLFQLRQEYGYDVDPNLPKFAEQIAEKEKAYRKEEKVLKTQTKKEKLKARMENIDQESTEEEKQGSQKTKDEADKKSE